MTELGDLPHEHLSEEYVVGAMVAFPRCIDTTSKLLRTQDFIDGQLGAIFAALCRHNVDGPVNPELVARELREIGHWDEQTSPAALMLELAQPERVGSDHHVSGECKRILEASRKRELFFIAEASCEAAKNGQTSDDVLSQMTADLWEFRRNVAAGTPQDRFTFEQLVTQYPTLREPVIDGIARAGETINIISHSKVGKSWFGYLLALCVVLGRSFLDRFATKQGKVLLIDNELHRETLAYRIREVANAAGIYESEYASDLEIWALRGQHKGLNELVDELVLIEPGQFSLIIWDSKYRISRPGASENSNDDETAFYNVIDQVGDSTGAVQALVHHATKGNQSDRRVTDVGAGGGAQARAADTHLVLREHEQPNMVVLDAAVRSFAPIEPMTLRWSFPLWLSDPADPSRLKRPPSPSEQRREQRDKEANDKIFTALLKDELSVRELRERTGLSRERLQRRLDWLTSEGHIDYSEIVKRGNSCRVYKTTNDPDS